MLGRLLKRFAGAQLRGAADDYLLNSDQLARVLTRERLRSDRNGQVFSLLVLTPRQRWADALATLVPVLQQRLRLTDDAGHMDARRLGIVLPDTPPWGAWKLADDLCELCPAGFAPPQCAVFAYPSPRDSDGDGPDDPDDRPSEPLDEVFAQPLPTWKRALDVVGASVALVLLAPLMLLAAVAVKLSSRGPVLFWQRREGLGGRVFEICKFRTMRVGAEAEQASLRQFSEQDGPAFKMQDDPRVFFVGKLLRTTSIDELPQLWNVLAGQMSLVGPRPLPCHESRACEPWQRRRLDVTPGITCTWQVWGRSSVTFREWVLMDLRYVHRRSLWTDVKLLAATVPAVLLRRGAK